MLRIFTFSLLTTVLFAFASCESSNTGLGTDTNDDYLSANTELDSALLAKGIVQKLDLVMENLVLCDMLVERLSKDQGQFDQSLLHDPNAQHRYATSKEKAVALGVYGADMNYILHFDQTQQSFRYLIVSKQLADNIGVAMAFDQNTMKDYQDNSSHKDSLINIVHAAYGNVKKHLKNSDQFLMSSLVIAGTWIENMYLATSHYNKEKNPAAKDEIYKTILDQQNYLSSVKNLLIDLANEDDRFTLQLTGQLGSIKNLMHREPDEKRDDQKMEILRQRITHIRDSLLFNN
jgi:hypothetical protein